MVDGRHALRHHRLWCSFHDLLRCVTQIEHAWPFYDRRHPVDQSVADQSAQEYYFQMEAVMGGLVIENQLKQE